VRCGKNIQPLPNNSTLSRFSKFLLPLESFILSSVADSSQSCHALYRDLAGPAGRERLINKKDSTSARASSLPGS
jgi:hypothetical protein